MESSSDYEDLDISTTQEENILSASTGFDEEEGFDDVFIDDPPSADMESPTGIPILLRRTSDVIDSIGELSISPVRTQQHSSSSTSDKIVSSATSQATNIKKPSSRQAELITESIDLGYSSPGAPSSSQSYQTNWFRYSFNSDADSIDAQPVQKYEQASSNNKVAKMPVVKDDELYNMDHEYRGIAVIINQEIFRENLVLTERKGSFKDVEELKTMFYSLDFTVIVWNNLCQSQILKNLEILALQDHTNNDCLAVVVLTHGMGASYIYAKDAPYPTEILWNTFTPDKCTTLAGKPKLFFVQACRGENLDSGILLSRETKPSTEVDSLAAAYKIPTYADFLITFSTYQGHYSFRNPSNGTWFIQSLCMEVNKNNLASLDFLGILTRVSRRVALEHESYAPESPWMHQLKQIPTIHTMLIRDLYFKPKNKLPPEPKIINNF